MHDEKLHNTHDFDVVGSVMDIVVDAKFPQVDIAQEAYNEAFEEADRKIVEAYLSDEAATKYEDEMNALEREGLSKLDFKEDGVYTEIVPDERDALGYQVGGDHYKKFKIQPIIFIQWNNLSFCEGNVVKYICRHKNKGQIEDLKKVIHYAKLEAELTYGVKL